MSTLPNDSARNPAKPAVDAVSTANVATLSGVATVGGNAALAQFSLVLLTAQTTGTENGIWQVMSGAWVRPPWFSAARHSEHGAIVFCAAGTYTGTYWRCDTAAVLPGTTDHTWVQASHLITLGGDLVANATTVVRSEPTTQALTIVAIGVKPRTTPASAGGTITLALAADGNNLISTATVDMELMTGGTEAAQTLTATGADLDIPRGAVIRATMVSNNADATGGLDTSVIVHCIPTAP